MIAPLGCGGEEHGDHEHCTDGESKCIDDMMISHCEGEAYADPVACPEGQMCMTMGDGMTHCMVPDMPMGGEGMGAMPGMDEGS